MMGVAVLVFSWSNEPYKYIYNTWNAEQMDN